MIKMKILCPAPAKACCVPSTSITILLKTISLGPKMHTIKCAYSNDFHNFRKLYFSKFYVYIEINAWNHDLHRFFTSFIIRIKFLGIFTMIFVISASIYVIVLNFNRIGGIRFSEIHPKQFITLLKTRIIHLG